MLARTEFSMCGGSPVILRLSVPLMAVVGTSIANANQADGRRMFAWFVANASSASHGTKGRLGGDVRARDSSPQRGGWTHALAVTPDLPVLGGPAGWLLHCRAAAG